MVGKLIVFEGVEGSGKSTQIQALYEWLLNSEILDHLKSQQQIKGVLLTREPGGTPLGQTIRQLLLTHDEQESVHNRTELLLYAADRAQHVAEYLQPAINEGYVVLCDRYTDSTIAYQAYGRQLDLSLIEHLNQIATAGLNSDLTFWLKLDVEIGLARMQARGQADRIERSGIEFHQRVQQGFESLAQKNSHRFITIEGNQNTAHITDQISQATFNFLQQWYPPQTGRSNK